MTDETPRDDRETGRPNEKTGRTGPDPERSVLSSLPRTRPGVRSPRRSSRREEAQPAGEARSDRARDRAPGGGGERPGPAGLEGVALGGVRAATEVAETGIRVGRWAAGALRNAIWRD